MRYLKLFENFNESNIHKICKEYGIKNYIINENGTIDVDGNVRLGNKRLKELPLKFRNVTGNFSCDNNQLTSLEGCPELISGYFNCSLNNLTSLEYCTKSIGNDFFCSHNKLTSLEFCSKSIGGDFCCSHNKLTSLEGCTELIEGHFQCKVNEIDSLKFMPKCFSFDCGYNNIRDFKYFVEPIDVLLCRENPIYDIWDLFENNSYIELLNDYDCIRGEDIVIDRLNEFLEEIDKQPVESVEGYNNI